MKEEKLKDCLNCQKELIHPEGRRPKKYCNDNCKAEHWRKTHKGKGKFVNRDRYEKLRLELEALKANSTQSSVKEEKAAESPKITPKPISGNRPSNLAELKAMCPFPDAGEERSAWIATNRQKFNI